MESGVVDVHTAECIEILSGFTNFDAMLLPARPGVDSYFEFREAERTIRDLIRNSLGLSRPIGEL
jgi:hypothetical protein